MRRPTTRLTAILLVLSSIALGVTGCSWLRSDPPEALQKQAEAAALALGSLDGVAAARGEVQDRDLMDHHGDWIVSIVVDAADSDGLTRLPAAVRATAGPATFSGAYRVDITLTVPGGPGIAPVTVTTLGDPLPADGSPPDELAATELLRRLPLAAAVSTDSFGPTVTLTEPAAAAVPADVEAAVRALPGFGIGALAAVTLLWPGDDGRSVQLSAPPASASPAPTAAPADRDAALAAASAAVTAFLAQAGVDGGHADAAPAVTVAECSDGAGQRASGTVLLPVWEGEAADDADTVAFDAVTGAWLTAGLQRVERASGLDIWAPATGGPGLERATIRGLPDGIRVTAESPCVQ
ncbi:hypothetical protein [Herbiconiux sp. VKM Ac-2851]|uniref:hypothetical protein n=1 Tax=Herbiconiux sp. VKM Ac-2851 TaxID=2739025 RepID=UPI0015657DAA|nr:hypothetical protein [Herbiconiux sp. VKM Ac-2851]NQX35514.1 hypothetical protein [Herbiconiux sp. VKM Ac-2851]